jgi:hypothetical protein
VSSVGSSGQQQQQIVSRNGNIVDLSKKEGREGEVQIELESENLFLMALTQIDLA